MFGWYCRFPLRNPLYALQKPGKNRRIQGQRPRSLHKWWTLTSATRPKYRITSKTTSKMYMVILISSWYLFIPKVIDNITFLCRLAIVPVTLLLRNCTKTSLDILVDTSKSPDR